MLMNEFGPRRGYDDRFEADWSRNARSWDGRAYDPRYEAQLRRWGSGDWMREMPWMRDSNGMREAHWANGLVEPTTRVVEIVAESPHSWEDAARRAVSEASQNVRGARSIWIKDMQAIVEDDRVVAYRIHAKISLLIDDSRWRR